MSVRGRPPASTPSLGLRGCPTHSGERGNGEMVRSARGRRLGALAAGLVLWLGAFASYGQFPFPRPVLAASSARPNRFDPTTRATSVPAAPLTAPAPGGRLSVVRRKPAGSALMAPGTVALDPSKPAHFASADSALELDIPAGAVTTADLA